MYDSFYVQIGETKLKLVTKGIRNMKLSQVFINPKG
jgi:hypothetical protein